MSLILNIDTATEQAHVSISKDGTVLQSLNNDMQRDHASFLQVAVQQLVQSAGIQLSHLDAISVTAGPGSYTGLRVGMSSAKGFCYALQKPLIALNTLAVLTTAVVKELQTNEAFLFCPMIDARRMEVFTAVYNNQLAPVINPCAMVLDATSFSELLQQNKIIFFGNGADKWQAISTNSNASFKHSFDPAKATAILSHDCFMRKHFADLAYSEPFYIKEFQDKI